ncbi:hypothetical protein GCM10009682_32950 [Luedemannella flava]|uniref:DUF7144 domain-containing protein n=2 Tax=Luedemannella flava TaxID=349316 RepID=A0ABP4YHI9_9ACTN
MIMGLYQVFMGIAAIAKGQFFIVAPNYVYSIDTTAWGWVHLGIGAIAAITGFFLFTQATWARWVGIAIAGLSAVANFFFLPYYPIWSLVIIAMDVFVIWSLAAVGSRDRTPVWGDEMAPSASAGMPMAAPMAPPMAGAPQEAMAGTRWPGNPPPTPTYDTMPSKGMAEPTGTPETEAAQQGMAGMAPPRPPTPSQ